MQLTLKITSRFVDTDLQSPRRIKEDRVTNAETYLETVTTAFALDNNGRLSLRYAGELNNSRESSQELHINDFAIEIET